MLSLGMSKLCLSLEHLVTFFPEQQKMRSTSNRKPKCVWSVYVCVCTQRQTVNSIIQVSGSSHSWSQLQLVIVYMSYAIPLSLKLVCGGFLSLKIKKVLNDMKKKFRLFFPLRYNIHITLCVWHVQCDDLILVYIDKYCHN